MHLKSPVLHAVLLFAFLFISGCSSLFPPPTKTTTLPDGTVISEPVVLTAGGFFESQNLKNHYDFEKARSDTHERVSTKKIDAIQINAVRMLADASTQVERVLIGVMTSMQLNSIQSAPPPSGLIAPKTMVDVAGSSLTGWLGIALQWYGIKEGTNNTSNTADSPSLVITGQGNSINYQSPGSYNPQHTLGDGAVGNFGSNYYVYPVDNSTTTKSTSLF